MTQNDADRRLSGRAGWLCRLILFGATLLAGAGAVARLTAAEPAATPPAGGAPVGDLTLSASDFASLPGWTDDKVAAALPAFLKSCGRFARQPAGAPIDPEAHAIDFGRISDWRSICQHALAVPRDDDGAVRQFFETHFVPALAGNRGDSHGLFTGYYETDLRASRERQGPFQYPVYRRPPDLVAGKPYLDRAAIDAGALKGKGLELVWLTSPDDVYVLQTQGSGRIHLPDGSVERLVYDGNNGREPVNIEKLLLDRGLIPPAEFSQQTVRAWMREHPVEAEALRRENPLYVFFREHKGDGPLGAQGAVLTPERSLAVDHRFVPLGVPLWLTAQDKYRKDVSLRRLVVAQDTGDGIEGPVRGDFYWGTGAEALRRGGDFYATGQYYLMLPKNIAYRLLAWR